jgi:hypothetical protein
MCISATPSSITPRGQISEITFYHIFSIKKNKIKKTVTCHLFPPITPTSYRSGILLGAVVGVGIIGFDRIKPKIIFNKYQKCIYV